MLRKCGEDSHGFYDKNGYYFREGVDPRNYCGRFVTGKVTPGGLMHLIGCPVFWGARCNCGEPINA